MINKKSLGLSIEEASENFNKFVKAKLKFDKENPHIVEALEKRQKELEAKTKTNSILSHISKQHEK